jgi:DNA topoisomerase IA
MKKVALCVAEKPSVAKAIAMYLSKKTTSGQQSELVKRMGRSKYNPIYEFDIKLKEIEYRMRVTSVLGHLMGL